MRAIRATFRSREVGLLALRRRKGEGGAFVVGRPLRAILDYAAWRR